MSNFKPSQSNISGIFFKICSNLTDLTQFRKKTFSKIIYLNTSFFNVKSIKIIASDFFIIQWNCRREKESQYKHTFFPIQNTSRKREKTNFVKNVSFLWMIVNCLLSGGEETTDAGIADAKKILQLCSRNSQITRVISIFIEQDG